MAGLVYAVCSEDLDCLVFGTPRMLKGFPSQNSNSETVNEINLENILNNIDISYSQFIDICILAGCDYSKGIKGIGVFKSLSLIKDHENIEGVIHFLNYSLEYEYEYEEARQLFFFPAVINPNEIQLKT